MTPYEEDLLAKYLTHSNVIGYEGEYPDVEAWYQAVRYTQSPEAPQDLVDSAELRYKDVLDAAQVFNRLHTTKN